MDFAEPVAIVIATLFWTILWGPIGLLLATPLTVCIVVLGTHGRSFYVMDDIAALRQFGVTPSRYAVVAR